MEGRTKGLTDGHTMRHTVRRRVWKCIIDQKTVRREWPLKIINFFSYNLDSVSSFLSKMLNSLHGFCGVNKKWMTFFSFHSNIFGFTLNWCTLLTSHYCFILSLLLFTSIYSCLVPFTSLYFCCLFFTSVLSCWLLFVSVHFSSFLFTSNRCILFTTVVEQ